MRIPADAIGATIAAAAAAGITVFDTARAYGGNERLVAVALRECRADHPRVVTKGGMSLVGGAWVPDGRAKAIRADCETSLVELDGLPIDTYLIHAPDPRSPWSTSVRALARLLDEGLVARIGLSNVNRAQLDEALELAPISVVEVALGVFDDRALRGGVVGRCAELGIAVIAHSPLGGPKRAGGIARLSALAEVGAARGATAAEVALGWLLDLSPVIVAIPGARRPETARSAAAAAAIRLDDDERAALAQLGRRTRAASQPVRDGEVVVVMGIPGAGKGRVAAELVDRGYVRLNRDERRGSLRALAAALDDELASGAPRVVLDNTYLTRASRSYVIDAAATHGLPARVVWVDTPLAQAQVNLVERLLERYGALPPPQELRARAHEPGVLAPTSQMRAVRELEPPSLDEGWAEVERRPFARAPRSDATATGVLVAAAAVGRPGWDDLLARAEPTAPHLVFDWRPDEEAASLEPVVRRVAAIVPGAVEGAVCPHPAGPPTCWCRPPLPGLALAFASAHGIDPARSLLVGTSPAHRTLATALGARYVP
jgi:aryl-alcohol dehydrogenase-like predicted oxidoreductase/adenylate kinase family enzyme